MSLSYKVPPLTSSTASHSVAIAGRPARLLQKAKEVYAVSIKVWVVKVDKDMALFDVEGLRFWGRLRKGKKHYTIVNERGMEVLKVPAVYGEKLFKVIEGGKNRFGGVFRVLLEKVEKGELDPFDVDLVALVHETKERLSLVDAGEFLLVCVKLLKYKLEYFFPSPPLQKQRKKITLQDVKNILEEEEADPFGEYLVKVGRPAGTPNRVKGNDEKHVESFGKFPLHKSFSWEEYARLIKELNLESWENFQRFFIPFQIERRELGFLWFGCKSEKVFDS